MLKKTVLSLITVSLLSSVIGAGAATLTLKDKKEELERQYSQSIEGYFQDSEGGNQEFIQEETQRMEKETRQHLEEVIQAKKLKDQEAIKAITDKYIQELDKFVDNLLASQ
jgi:hypothetical protein